MNTIENSPKPVISIINGYAFGGGCEVALACHIRFASDNAIFAQPEVKLGLIPGWGGTQRLPRIVGKGIANEMIISGKPIDAEEAYRIGLVNKVYKKETLMNESLKFAKNILNNGPNAVSKSLSLINDSSSLKLEKRFKKEAKVFSSLFDNSETKEGLDAFLKKGKQIFSLKAMIKYVILAINSFDYILSKTGNMLIRYQNKSVVAIVDPNNENKTAEQVLGWGGQIPVVRNVQNSLQYKPTHLVIGNAPQGGILDDINRKEIIFGIKID